MPVLSQLPWSAGRTDGLEGAPKVVLRFLVALAELQVAEQEREALKQLNVPVQRRALHRLVETGNAHGQVHQRHVGLLQPRAQQAGCRDPNQTLARGNSYPPFARPLPERTLPDGAPIMTP